MEQFDMNAWLPWLRIQTAQLLECPIEEVAVATSLSELGVDSVIALRLAGIVSDRLGHDFDPTMLFDYPTLSKLSGYLQKMTSLAEQ